MHGYIARWLRIMGYDTLYLRNMDDDEAIRIASEGRILITSDAELARYAETRGVKVFVIKGLSEKEALETLVKKFNLAFREDFSRCTVCNGELESIGLEEAGSILGFTPKGVNAFWKCKSCGKVYWRGSHWKNISRQILRLVDNEPAGKTV